LPDAERLKYDAASVRKAMEKATVPFGQRACTLGWVFRRTKSFLK
jgi:hypothetical protein